MTAAATSKGDMPIGIFDSGIGGLSVLKAIRERLPNESLVYVADSAHAPYGGQAPAAILDRAGKICEFLIQEQGVKAIVVACNTATAAAIDELRNLYAFPIIGMEPAVKPAVEQTRSGVIGVMATVYTLASERFQTLLHRHAGETRVLTQACPGLVEQVEAGDLDGPKTRELVSRYTQALIQAGADQLILGCTHYPFLESVIRDEAGPSVNLIETGMPVARHLTHRLNALGLLSNQGDLEKPSRAARVQGGRNAATKTYPKTYQADRRGSEYRPTQIGQQSDRAAGFSRPPQANAEVSWFSSSLDTPNLPASLLCNLPAPQPLPDAYR